MPLRLPAFPWSVKSDDTAAPGQQTKSKDTNAKLREQRLRQQIRQSNLSNEEEKKKNFIERTIEEAEQVGRKITQAVKATEHKIEGVVEEAEKFVSEGCKSMTGHHVDHVDHVALSEAGSDCEEPLVMKFDALKLNEVDRNDFKSELLTRLGIPKEAMGKLKMVLREQFMGSIIVEISPDAFAGGSQEDMMSVLKVAQSQRIEVMGATGKVEVTEKLTAAHQCLYKIGDRVQVRDDDEQQWSLGIVTFADPLRVRVYGSKASRSWKQVFTAQEACEYLPFFIGSALVLRSNDDQDRFLVDDRFLKSNQAGLHVYNSQNIEDRGERCIVFGTTVDGIVEQSENGGKWLRLTNKVGVIELSMELDNVIYEDLTANAALANRFKAYLSDRVASSAGGKVAGLIEPELVQTALSAGCSVIAACKITPPPLLAAHVASEIFASSLTSDILAKVQALPGIAEVSTGNMAVTVVRAPKVTEAGSDEDLLATSRGANEVEGIYKIGDNVQARDGDDQEWRRGAVTSVGPLLVRIFGWKASRNWKQIRDGQAIQYLPFISEGALVIRSTNETFIVDNRLLKSQRAGLAICNSQNIEDRSKQIICFGSTVRGIEEESEDGTKWLQLTSKAEVVEFSMKFSNVACADLVANAALADSVTACLTDCIAAAAGATVEHEVGMLVQGVKQRWPGIVESDVAQIALAAGSVVAAFQITTPVGVRAYDVEADLRSGSVSSDILKGIEAVPGLEEVCTGDIAAKILRAPGVAKKHASDEDQTNDEDAPVRPGTDGRTYYCGRHLGKDALPGTNGCCGPNNGLQCHSCTRYQFKAAAAPVAAAPAEVTGPVVDPVVVAAPAAPAAPVVPKAAAMISTEETVVMKFDALKLSEVDQDAFKSELLARLCIPKEALGKFKVVLKEGSIIAEISVDAVAGGSLKDIMSVLKVAQSQPIEVMGASAKVEVTGEKLGKLMEAHQAIPLAPSKELDESIISDELHESLDKVKIDIGERPALLPDDDEPPVLKTMDEERPATGKSKPIFLKSHKFVDKALTIRHPGQAAILIGKQSMGERVELNLAEESTRWEPVLLPSLSPEGRFSQAGRRFSEAGSQDGRKCDNRGFSVSPNAGGQFSLSPRTCFLGLDCTADRKASETSQRCAGEASPGREASSRNFQSPCSSREVSPGREASSRSCF